MSLAQLASRHLSSYLCGAYLGGMSAPCRPLFVWIPIHRWATVPNGWRKAVTGGRVKQWTLSIGAGNLRRAKFAASYVVVPTLPLAGWLMIDCWRCLGRGCQNTLPRCCRMRELHGPSERRLAYALGWMTHVIGDGLIKSVAPGLDLNLLDEIHPHQSTYSGSGDIPRNRHQRIGAQLAGALCG